MGGGVCWLDYNNDGWQDLFAVNSYASADAAQWEAHGGLPRTALFENVDGTFKDVSADTHADLPVQGDGCVAADLNGDGHTDLVVTTTSGVDVLWNTGHGTFTQRAAPGERLVHRRRRRGRERRRPAGPVRRRLLRSESAGTELARRLPDERRGRPRPALSERGRRALQRGRRPGGPRGRQLPTTGSERPSPMSTATAAGHLRRERRGPEPALRQCRLGPAARAPIRPGSASASRSARPPPGSPTRTPEWEWRPASRPAAASASS